MIVIIKSTMAAAKALYLLNLSWVAKRDDLCVTLEE